MIPVAIWVPSLVSFQVQGTSGSDRLTNFILDLIGHIGNFVEQRQALVHPLLDHTQVGHHLKREVKKGPQIYF